MAAPWRLCRRCRVQAPSRISSRNRNICYLALCLVLVTTVLMIPGSEIAHYKYAEGAGKDIFLTKFSDDRGLGEDSLLREQRSVNNEFKVVLLWTDFFGSSTWREENDPFPACPVSTCELTTDKERVAEAAAVMFNARSLNDPSQLPPEHPPWQAGSVWTLHNSEPPYFTFLDLPLYDNVFNWTSSYRTDADIYSPYGGYVKKEPPPPPSDDNDYGDDVISKLVSIVKNSTADENASDVNQEDVQDVGTPDVYGMHDSLLYWMASNCRDRARRYVKVAKIARYLPVDTYGQCGTMQCQPRTQECEQMLSRYQFVLAFENGYCRDYVTEKLWDAYFRYQIPIVSGGADYSKFAIPNSYIDYDNFSSVEELVDHILRVSSDRDLYNSYFEWMNHYAVVRTPVANWCQICEALHDKGRQPQVYSDLVGWMGQDSCPMYSVSSSVYNGFGRYRCEG
ncbi:hypothetical protein BaRGS_00028875 [Batillaria attramentaria]|uniref:Fucosyltransferase n=1 Tax=Batillaria attramentaria TaxID=370345 RepID=A0ABD0JXM1_9CAEN